MANEQRVDEQPGLENETTEAETGETVEDCAGSVIDECEELLARKEAELKQVQDRLLRLAAETENARKRLEREKTDGIAFANESLIRNLLPVIDNLESAVAHGEQEADFQSLMEGVRMTLKGFSDALARFGCNSFDSAEKPFDPNYHEAVAQVEHPDKPDMTVIEEYRKGYTLNDRLLRAAMVVVSKGNKSSE